HDLAGIAAGLEEAYGLRPVAIRFLPIGYDLEAAVYEVIADDGKTYFLKVRSRPIYEAGLRAAQALREQGVLNILAPIPTRSGELGDRVGDRGLVLYPFITGENAMVAGLTGAQWEAFGVTLRAVHESGVAASFRDQLRVESFALPSAALVRDILDGSDGATFESPAAAGLALFWREHAGQIRAMLERAEALGARLQNRGFAYVLCHGDIHAANILVDRGGRIHLVDWDAPLLAPRERDLLFVVGSKIARDVEPHEEARFFAGYGPVAIDPDALVYYRYERAIEDFGEIGKSVFRHPERSEEARADEAALMMGYFAPGGFVDSIETVILPEVRPASG
ncbi:MAG: aminoglycoside phosphotransferase family protein, partial [Thermomicrobiales bacterium]|nr:aminoglycoside phosphotransferase family protein [Thermomicrobiales bacterium]